MSYTVLARRYRSSTFDEVIGQEPIARTLINAIGSARVAHAYLFTGTRGVGKTTTARLFARALNAPDTIPGCPHLGAGLDGRDSGKKKSKKAESDDGQYPPLDVQQRMAEAIMRGDDLNVIEIDGASNRGVDEARQLIANAGLAPTGNARFKVYIIDEVHMLTREAFNALLKTMEEPPAHVKFILCTTEPHKVPATIQSRCQRFDFRNIPTARIAEHLKDVLGKEKIKAKEEVIWQVARLGNGSMRDALSLLDRLIATGEHPLTSEILEQMLGLPPEELVVSLVDAMAGGDVGRTLARTDELLRRGIAEEQLTGVLIERLRQLMLIAACGEASELIELSDDAKKTAAEQAKHFDAAGLVHMIALCENLHQAARRSSSPRALLDATMVRLALAEKMADVTALLSSDQPKKKVQPGASEVGVAAADRVAERQAPPQTPTAAPVQTPRQASPSPSPAPAPMPPRAAQPPAPAREVSPFNDEGAASPAAAPRTASPSTSPASAPPAIDDAGPIDAEAVWDRVLTSVRDKAPLSWVGQLSLVRIERGAAYLAPRASSRMMRDFVRDRQRQQLADLFRAVLGRPVRIEMESEAGASPRPSGASAASESQRAPESNDRREAMALPLVKLIMQEFDATLVETHVEDVRVADDANGNTDDQE